MMESFILKISIKNFKKMKMTYISTEELLRAFACIRKYPDIFYLSYSRTASESV